MTDKNKQRGKKEAGPRARLASFLLRMKSLDYTTKLLVASVGFSCVVMAGVVLAIVLGPATPAPIPPSVQTSIHRHPLTGVVVTEAYTVLPQVFGVMVENSSEAWPLAGLDEAFLVIEAPVEAAIPRFIAFYSDENTTERIGPVRSARPYYLDWADEFGALYAHVGGSPEALDLIAQFGTLDLNEFYQGEYFYRDTNGRYAPHNVYTTIEDLQRAVEELQLDEPDYEAWSFADGEASGEAKSLAIDWTSNTNYDVSWNYDVAMNTYERLQGGTRHFLEARADVRADNVVVMATDIEVVDSSGRRHVRTVGEGAAMIAQNGRVIVGSWRKDTRTDRLRFYDESGSEITMNAGKTWIEVVDSLGQVTVSE